MGFQIHWENSPDKERLEEGVLPSRRVEALFSRQPRKDDMCKPLL